MVDGDYMYHDLPRQLIAACECGDIDTVQQLLDDEADSIEVDCDGGEGFTPLQIAAANNHESIVRLLLMRGAGLDTQNNYGWTALMQAAYHGYTNIVVLLLQNKANPSIRNKMGATALTFASFKGHADIVNIFLELSGVDSNNHREGEIYEQILTPAIVSIMNGHQAILRQLMNRGSPMFFTDSGTGWTLLMVAALSGHVGAVQYLVDSGCNPNALNINNMTPFDIAAVCKHKKVKEILEKKTVNRPTAGDGSSESQIIEATEQGDIKLVQRILDKDPMQSNYTSVDGATPLMIASMLGRRDIAETLVQRGAEVNRQDGKSGWTALMQATFHRRKDVVKYLIQAGADLNIQARDGCKALDLALVIVSDDTDKIGSELTRLLAPITMLTMGNGQLAGQVKDQGSIQMWSTRINSVDQMEDQEDAKQSGLRAWWSRMSNRFRNLKLTRTLRGGLGSTTKLTPFPDENARPDETLKSMGSNSYLNIGESGREGSKHQRRKSKEGSRVSFDKSNTKPDAVQTLDMQAPQSKTSDKLLPVIPPFLPPPSFELHNADKSRRSHSKAQGMGPGRPSSKLSSNNTNTTSTTSTTTDASTTSTGRMHRPMFTTRRPGSTGISPSNSAHFSSTISPSSSGEASALSRGLLSARKQGHSASSVVLTSRALHGSSSNRAGDSYGSMVPMEDQLGTRKRYASASSVPSLAQIPSSPTSRHSSESNTPTSNPPNRRHSANLSSTTGPSSYSHRPKTRSHSGSASTRTSSTLTPSPSPTPMGRGRMSGGGGSSHSGSVGGAQREGGAVVRKTSAGSSSISEEDELSNLLRKLSLEKYAPIFEEQEVDMEAFLALNDSDLKEMGIRHKEPRNQILTAITQMNSGKQNDSTHDNYSPSTTRYAFQR